MIRRFEKILHNFLIYLNIDIGPSIVVENIKFFHVIRTLSGTHSVGFASEYVLKIEHEPNPNKVRKLWQEAEIIAELNEMGCVSCPRLISTGVLPDGEPYLILERIKSEGTPKVADMLLSLIEQKSLGVYQGDFKPANMVFDGNICFLVDYDQAQKNDAFVNMGNTEFIEWIGKDFQNRRNQDFFTQEDRNFNKQEFLNHFEEDSFNMALTSVLTKQMTTRTKLGIYHKLNFPQIHTNGARDISSRISILNQIEFKHGERVLDVGCNLGLLSHYLTDRGCIVTGIEMDPNVVQAARIVANIVGKSIDFQTLDMSTITLEREFYTICLFSVFHHIQDIDHAAMYISRRCQRVILESKLHESGSVPVKGKWKRSNVWRFDSTEELVAYMEKMLPGFTLEKIWGQGDRDRYIFTFFRK
jgi:2-polyprenyl-3-methyl-5-hydroxy-6-metoxy-1,4-benzoquinol methylase